MGEYDDDFRDISMRLNDIKNLLDKIYLILTQGKRIEEEHKAREEWQ